MGSRFPSPARFTFERILPAVFATAALIVLVLAATAWTVLRDAGQAAGRVAHTNNVLDDIARIREATTLIESLTRGFVISGERRALAGHSAAAQERDAAVRRIKTLAAQKPHQQERLARLDAAIEMRRALSARAILLRESAGFDAAREFSISKPLAETREIYFQVLREMEDDERRLLKEHEASQKHARDIAVLVNAAAALAIMALLAAAFVMLRRQMRATTAAQHTLERANLVLQAARESADQANAAKDVFLATMSHEIRTPLSGMLRRQMRATTAAQHTLERANLTLQEARESADQANAAKDVFLATMSHEIRTPLSGMLGMLELLSYSRLEREQSETLSIARDSGRALGRIVDDVLDHAKMDAGKLAIVPEPVALAQLLPRIVNTYYAMASGKGIMLRQMTDPRISPLLLADSLRLVQVLGNLVSNALKFTSEGYIELRADLIERTGTHETVRLSVRDTGIGMSAEQQGRLFQPFEQATADTAHVYGGTGLGLAICARLAALMDGTMHIESTLGKGTMMSLTLTLPLFSGSASDSAEHFAANRADAGPEQRMGERRAGAGSAETAPASAQGPWILAVDDSPTNRMLIARQIRLLGLRVQIAADGYEALTEWRGGSFALVITDCNMPEMDGYALARAIRDTEQAQGRPRTPMLAWTANALPATVALCHAAGIDDLLIKPSELGQLKALLGKWLPAPSPLPPAPAALAVIPTPSPSVTPSVTPPVMPAAAGAEDVINLRYFGVTSETDREEVMALAQEVCTSIRAQVPVITTALAALDIETITLASHNLGGSAGMLGAKTLAKLCRSIETAARGGDAAALARLQEPFVSEAQRVIAALDAI